MFGGKAVTPLTIRTMYGGGLRAASQHSQCLYPMFTHVPGIKVVLPSNPYDAKGLLIQSIEIMILLFLWNIKIFMTLQVMCQMSHIQFLLVKLILLEKVKINFFYCYGSNCWHMQ